MKRVELDDLLKEQKDTNTAPFPSLEEQCTPPEGVPVGLLTMDFVMVHTNSEPLEPRYGFRPAHNLALDLYEALYLILQDKLIVEATKIRDKDLHEICEDLERAEKETRRGREARMVHLEYKSMIPRTLPKLTMS